MTRCNEAGWLYSTGEMSCRWRQSPFYNARPDGVPIELVVVHGISLPAGSFGGPWVDTLFTQGFTADSPLGLSELAAVEVSAHFFIDRHGDLTQYVSLWDRAWHAGVSVFEQKPNCNDFSIGIELEGTDLTPYTDAQMQSLGLLCAALRADIPSIRAITGHSTIAPGRKTDPGPAFSWQDLSSRLAHHAVVWQVVTDTTIALAPEK
jgi:N-acetyl-anhydromuramoyl-L-alanine amidase